MVPVIVLPFLLIVPRLLKMPEVVIPEALISMVAPVVFVVVAPESFVNRAYIESVPSLVKVLPEPLVIPTPLRS